jgi:transposase
MLMAAYSQDLRDRVLRGIERGESPSSIAARLEVSRMWVYQVKQRFEREGRRTSHAVGGYRKSRLAPLEQVLRSWIKAQPDLTLHDMCERLKEEHGVEIKPPALWHQLNNWKLSYKKNSARSRARQRRRSGGQAQVD